MAGSLGRPLNVMLFDELAEEVHNFALLLAVAQMMQKASPACHHGLFVLGAHWEVEMVAEGEKERLGGELGQHALDVEEIRAPPLDLSPVVSHAAEQSAFVRRAPQCLVVSVQNAYVSTVAAQSMENTGACG